MGLDREQWKTILVIVFLLVFFTLVWLKPMLAVVMFLIVMLVGIGAKIRKQQGHVRPPKNQNK